MKLLFNNRLRALRKEKRLKQSELAKKLSTTQRKISYWEAGKTEPDLQSIWLIADYFDVSIDYLIGRKEY